MSKDLDATVAALGADYRAVVDRLKAAQEITPKGRVSPFRIVRLSGPCRLAASLLFLAGLCVVFVPRAQSPSRPTESVRPPREYVLTVQEMIATQKPDGSWQNDFLTRRNAEALKHCGTPSARIAYKKAMRNLRSRGVL